jgi:hypothetical protein
MTVRDDHAAGKTGTCIACKSRITVPQPVVRNPKLPPPIPVRSNPQPGAAIGALPLDSNLAAFLSDGPKPQPTLPASTVHSGGATRRWSPAASAALKFLAFILSMPIGVVVAVIGHMFVFPEANGAVPTGIAVFCCYLSYQVLQSTFGIDNG